MPVRTPKRRRGAPRKRTAAPPKAVRARRMATAKRGPRGETVQFRSQFERRLRDRLDKEGVIYAYERDTYRITVPVSGARCTTCGSSRGVVRNSTYTPDFFFRHFIVESKGKFTARDRKRVLAYRVAYPGHSYAILFQRDNKLSKTSKTRYTEWATAHGIPCAVGWFKPEWVR